MGIKAKAATRKISAAKEALTELRAKVLSGLGEDGILEIYKDLGVEFTGQSHEDWHECYALREDGDRDSKPSACVNIASGVYKDSGRDLTLSIFDFVHKHKGFEQLHEAVAYVCEQAGEDFGSLKKSKERILEAAYEYRNADDELAYEVQRFRNPDGSKTFTQRKPGARGNWIYSIKDVEPVPYRLPALLKASSKRTVYIVEGEKCVEALRSLRFVATCNSGGVGGAKQWEKLAQWFDGRAVIICPDRDDAGRKLARKIADALNGKAASIKFLEVPQGNDVADWIEAGGTREQWEKLSASAVDFLPSVIESQDAEPSLEEEAEAIEWGTLKLRKELEPLPFPLDVFPDALRSFVSEIAESTQGSVDHAASLALAVAGGAIGNALAVQVKAGYIERPLLYLAAVGPPGQRKSPIIKALSEPLWRIDSRLYMDFKNRRDAWIQGGRVGAPPVNVQTMLEDTTSEALVRVLESSPKGVLASYDELQSWYASFNRYSGGKGSDLNMWLKLWAGGSIKVTRRGQTGGRDNAEPVNVRMPFVTVCGAMVPDTIQDLQTKRDDGWFDRLLFSYPKPQAVGDWTEKEIDDASRAAWEEAIERLHSLEMLGTDTLYPCANLLTFTDKAKELFIETINAHRAEQRDTTTFSTSLGGPWAKLEGYFARFCVILRALRWAYYEPQRACPKKIESEIVEAACKLLAYFKNHHRRARGSLLRDFEIPLDAVDLIKFLRDVPDRASPISERDIKRKFPRFYENPHSFEDVSKWLFKANVIRYIHPSESQETKKRGRKASVRWAVNPELYLENPES